MRGVEPVDGSASAPVAVLEQCFERSYRREHEIGGRDRDRQLRWMIVAVRAFGGLLLALSLLSWGDGEASDGLPWITYGVEPGQTLDEVAALHGVTEASLRDWNPSLLVGRPHDGAHLRIRPQRFVAPRQPRPLFVREGESWTTLAQRFGLRVEDLARWNPKWADEAEPPRGRRLQAYVASGIARLPSDEPLMLPPLPEVAEGGRSVGRPQLGSLEGGVPVPASDLYVIRIPEASYGSTFAVRSLLRGIAGFRVETEFDGPLYLGAMSLPGGKKFPPHSSHQSGRDADIRMPALPYAYAWGELMPWDVDWYATWCLVDAFVRTGTVDVVFVDRKFHRTLRKAAARLGASEERIDATMAKVQHAGGHRGHVHVRFMCGDDSPECTGEHRI